MDSSELAAKMLEWEKGTNAMNALAAEIEAEVIKIGSTQKVGHCTVSFRNGTRSFDYKTPASEAPKEIIDRFTTSVKVVNWDGVAQTVPDVVEEFTTIKYDIDYKAVLKEAKIEPLVVSQTAPTATIKLEN